jgi:deoxyribose-phosphate aldolase
MATRTKSAPAIKAVSQRNELVVVAPSHLRNAGVPLAVDWFEGVDVNLSAAERRAATLTTRRTVKKQWQAAWLIRAVECIDLTTLAGDDTEGRVERLCAKARHPLRDDLKKALGLQDYDLTTGTFEPRKALTASGTIAG